MRGVWANVEVAVAVAVAAVVATRATVGEGGDPGLQRVEGQIRLSCTAANTNAHAAANALLCSPEKGLVLIADEDGDGHVDRAERPCQRERTVRQGSVRNIV